jgi:hypothetical protein
VGTATGAMIVSSARVRHKLRPATTSRMAFTIVTGSLDCQQFRPTVTPRIPVAIAASSAPWNA